MESEFLDLYIDFPLNETLNELSNDTIFETIANDFHQTNIYNEMKDRNQLIEYNRHIFGVLGSLVSVIGIFGKSFKLFK
jgi:hypothetical protein